MARHQISENVRRRAGLLGEAGAAWLAGVDGLVDDLAREWDLDLGASLQGGTEALVLEATLADGRPAILKLTLPGIDRRGGELATLRLAGGRGYAEVYRHDGARRAVLMERLGPQLHELGWPIEAQIEAICATLQAAWTRPADLSGLMTGAEKAAGLARLISRRWAATGRPCAERTIETALAFAEDRRRAYDPKAAVLAHGDAHAWNTLQVPGADPARFKFVDPDGLFAEPAYDLGIAMREWEDELLAGDPLALGRARCALLSRLTGVPEEPIWRWGFLERVSTGLLLKEMGLDELAGNFLKVADAWAGSP
ncbi:MAG TPA: aminoglycoside phosphotransferase family protein [Phenylobacterium sp.]|nr:aminoglycoside phosphotransferase family protein [Phenylobacterium sp.]